MTDVQLLTALASGLRRADGGGRARRRVTLLILAGAGLALLATTDRIGKPTDADPPNVKEIGRAGIISS